MLWEKPLVVCIGEILWDSLPTGKVLGGAPANVGWHAAQLGADSHILSAIGNDEQGDKLLEYLNGMNMSCSHIYRIDGKPTSVVEAEISSDGVASYSIHQNVAWDFIPVTASAIELLRRAQAINFGTLSQRTGYGRHVMQSYLNNASSGCLKLFDVNLRPGSMSNEVLEAGFSLCDIVKLNAEELLVIADLFNWPGQAEKVLDEILGSYSNIEHIIVTRGADGAWWKTRSELLQRPGISVHIADTIGAGDSLTAAVIMGILQDKDPKTILEAALLISSFVCTQVGATPRLPEHLLGVYGRDLTEHSS